MRVEMELRRFSVFWCRTILFGSVLLQEAGEFDSQTYKSFFSPQLPAAFRGIYATAQKVPESQLNETYTRYYTVITQLYGRF